MTFAKAKPNIPNARDYIGNSDGPAKQARPGMDEFIKQIIRVSDGALFNNGSFGQRDVRGKPGTLSVHATGRAVDLSYRASAQHPKSNRKNARAVINRILEHANDFGIQAVLDYFPVPCGAGWRCDRQAWEKYTRPTLTGAPRGDWYHVELDPRMADNPEAVKAVFKKVFG
jgi:hypothetical protein